MVGLLYLKSEVQRIILLSSYLVPYYNLKLNSFIIYLRCFFQGSLEEWLRLLRLEEYGPALVAQGYRTVHDVTQLAWEVTFLTVLPVYFIHFLVYVCFVKC